LIDRVKRFMYRNLKKHAFIVVTLFASIPNPLFDLAGLTCGHFMIPFATFFGATFIGKAIVKVSIQCFFVIFMFSAHHVENLLSIIEGAIPSLSGYLSTSLEKQKSKLYQAEVKTEDPSII
jgi:vacuole membrane protein 1